jgi:hypothetical protein
MNWGRRHPSGRLFLAACLGAMVLLKVDYSLAQHSGRGFLTDYEMLGISGEAWGIVALLSECALAVLLLTSKWRLGGRLVAYYASIASVFSAGLSLTYGRQVDCGCMGRIDLDPSGRAIILLGLFCAGLWLASAWDESLD